MNTGTAELCSSPNDPSITDRRRFGGTMLSHVASVLVVEDHADLREMLAVLLESEGYEVQTAGNGVEALTALARGRPSVILLDLMMPVMSGDEFRERQLADPRYRDVPVICMSAAHDGRARCERMHAAQYFQKPVDFDRLLGAVRECANEGEQGGWGR
jgi:CheY-like chemotaxis protein